MKSAIPPYTYEYRDPEQLLHGRRERAKELRLLLFLLLPLLLCSLPTRAQLPPGTIDTTSAPQPAPPDPLRAQATEALEKQDYDAAFPLLNQLAAKYPTDASILYNLGFIEDTRNHDAEAAQNYRKAIAADANYFEPHLALGLLLARTGKLPEAHAELTTAATLSTSDNNLKAHAYRALARLDQSSDPAAASSDLLEALKLSPESIRDALLTGELAESANDLPSAEAAYRRILKTHADDPELTAALAHLLLRLKRAPEAEPLLTAALAKHPDDPTLTSQLAVVYAAQGKAADAIPLVEKLHAAAPTDENMTRLLAHLYSDGQQPERAGPLYTALLAQHPHEVGLLVDSGENQLTLHHYPQAQATLTEAIADPKAFSNPTDLGNVAGDLAFAASQNNAQELVLHALDVRATVLPPSPVSLFLSATAHDSLRQFKQATVLYQQFLTASAGKYPDEEQEAKARLLALQHTR